MDEAEPGVLPISQRAFSIYALSLPNGPNFGELALGPTWKAKNDLGAGAVLLETATGKYSVLVLRRRTDHRWVPVLEKNGFVSEEAAKTELFNALRSGKAAEPVPPGAKKRKLLMQPTTKAIGENFKLLSHKSHFPAWMAIGEVYLAMPNPDDNFVQDFQTANFDSRLFELYLLAAFREQGVAVSHNEVSPDFFISREGHSCYVEAVTANPHGSRTQGLTMPTFAPEKREERLLGPAAERFAKTLRSKLQREYEKLPHVHGKPFVLAIADFHAPSSMVWTREALPTYLYGIQAKVVDGPEGPKAVGAPVNKLLGEKAIPAGLFRDPAMSHLSAVISSNAATLGKFNRMGFLAGWRPPGLSMIRQGILFDRTPGAVEPIPFELDIMSEEYAKLWDGGEAWCQEMEVFHNPLAAHPIERDLLPGATHWVEVDGEVVCFTFWENSVISSVTRLNVMR